MKNIIIRTLTGTVYVALIVFSLLFHPLIFGILLVFVNFTSLLEFNKMNRKLGLNNPKIWIYINVFLFSIAMAVTGLDMPPGYLLIPLLGLLVLLILIPLYQKAGNPAFNQAFSLFGTVYISVPLVLLTLIQQLSHQQGIPFALAIFVIIWTNDTFAFLTGRVFGKSKMFKRVSPKKSWEGFLGGLVSGMSASMAFYYFFPQPGLINWLIFGFLTVVSAVMGDFTESLLKRTSDVKDSGSILPGHGGMLDRIDSLLIATPVVFLYLSIIIKL